MESADIAAPRMSRGVARLVGACARRPWLAIAIAAALGVTSAFYIVGHFVIDTDTANLFAADLPWRRQQAALDAAFAQRVDPIAVVIDAATPELAEGAAASLARRLASEPRVFRRVERPDGGPFFAREGILFSPVSEVADTMQRLVAAEPLLGTLAADPTIRGVMDAIALMVEGGKRDPETLSQLSPAIAALADALEAALSAGPAQFSWRTMLSGRLADPRELRRFVLAYPVLDFHALEPGAMATGAIRASIRDLGLAGDPRVRIRLTGPVPLADQEFATLVEHADVNAALMMVAILTLLWLALRSARLVAAVILSLVAGLVLTTALGLAAFGRFNLISIAFAVLFVGLGVDFGIQYCVRYREMRFAHGDIVVALRRAGAEIGGSLALAAASTAAGFYAFAPTEYRGVAELGVIAGTGMLIALLSSITLLPALIVAMGAPAEVRAIGYSRFARLGGVLARRRWWIVGGAGFVAAGCIAILPALRFDFNPLNLKSPAVESVATLLDLMRDPATTPNTIDVLAPSLATGVALARRLEALPEVDHVLTLASFVPERQDQKLALISDTALLLEPVVHPPPPKPAPDDAETVRALRAAAGALNGVRPAAPAGADSAIARLASAMERLAGSDPAARQRAQAALIPGLEVMLDQMRAALSAEAVTVETLPADRVADWVAPDGHARLEVYPAGDSNDNATLRRFVDAVRRVAPDATGLPVSIQESGRTIVRAFLEAGLWALTAIVIILALALRSVAGVALTLAPLLLSALLTLGVCALTGFALNFENIIALPLLFGIGVAFDIYFIIAWRAGRSHLLESGLTRAVLYSALTTGAAFGSLALSPHPGTSSMGRLLALSLATTLLTVLVFLPALLATRRVRR